MIGWISKKVLGNSKSTFTGNTSSSVRFFENVISIVELDSSLLKFGTIYRKHPASVSYVAFSSEPTFGDSLFGYRNVNVSYESDSILRYAELNSTSIATVPSLNQQVIVNGTSVDGSALA